MNVTTSCAPYHSQKLSPQNCRRNGFTLIELLVTLGIIAILVTLLLTGLSGARFRSKVANCTSNYKQWGIAVSLYANDDDRGRLPTFPLELSKFSSYNDLYPWMVSLQMGTNLEPYGLDVPLWFCPQRAEQYRIAKRHYLQLSGRSLRTMTDLTDLWSSATKFFAVIDNSWFVPRPLINSEEVFPSPKVINCRNPLGWPVSIEDEAGATQPILTDVANASWNSDKTRFNSNGTMHQWPGRISKNMNLLFVDGHVETRNINQVQWQIEHSSGDSVIVY